MDSTLERTHAKTKEEKYLLVRSNKKVRADDNKPEVLPPNVEMTTKDNAFTGVSFKELLGQRLENLDEDLISEDEKDEGSDEDEEID